MIKSSLRKNILIIHPGPLGNHTGTYYFCLLLKEKYNVTYVGIDEGKGFKIIEGINQIHLRVKKNRLLRKFEYFKLVNLYLNKSEYNFVLINYFPLCSIINLFTKSKLVVEIRTSYLFNSFLKRTSYNLLLSLEARFFSGIITLSENLKNYLNLPNRTHIVPLGGPLFQKINKDFNTLNFLYVGTFHKRNITKTIIAFKNFLELSRPTIAIQYHIIGFGSEIDILDIKETIKNNNLESWVHFHGEIRYPELTNYFNDCNVGISYIPLNSFFQSQPPTKTYEYLLSGMAVLATCTDENKLVIDSSNGALSDDTIKGVESAFNYIYINRFSFNSLLIQENSFKYSWNYITDSILIPYIESFKN